MPQIIELYGFETRDISEKARQSRASMLCPFVGGKCTKKFSDGEPNGVCSLSRGEGVLPVCPKRLYADSYRPLNDIAARCFPAGLPVVRSPAYAKRDHPRGAVLVFGKGSGGELRLPSRAALGTGSYFVDWILVYVDGSGSLVEFVAVEVQTIDTTGKYRGERNALMVGEEEGDNSAGFNWENVNKRILPQLIYKGHVLHREEKCRKGLFFVCPFQIHENMMQRLGGKMRLAVYPQQPGTITFMPYIVSATVPSPGAQRELRLDASAVFTTEVRQIEMAFSSPQNLPDAGVYESAIRAALATL